MARTVVTVLAAAVVAGVGAGLAAADTVTDTTATETSAATETTAPAQTTVTVTESQTTTVQATLGPTATATTVTPATTAETTSGSSGGGLPTWAIVLIVVAGIGLVAAIAYLLGRGRKSADSELDGRRRILDAAVSSAVASGWTVESTSGLGAVIRRNGDRAVLSVDEHGQIVRRPLEGDEPAP